MTFVGWGDCVPIFLNQIFEFEVWGRFGSVQRCRTDGSFGFSAPIQCIRLFIKSSCETSPSCNPDLSIPLCPSSSHTTHDLTFHCVKSVSKLHHLWRILENSLRNPQKPWRTREDSNLWPLPSEGSAIHIYHWKCLVFHRFSYQYYCIWTFLCGNAVVAECMSKEIKMYK